MANVTRSIMANGSVSDIYTLWAQFENFPNFMKHIRSVNYIRPNATHWVMQGPLGKTIEWDAVTTVQEPNRRIAWQSTGGNVKHGGNVIFEQVTPDQVRITATIDFELPGGELGEKLVQYFGDLDGRVQEDLENFRNYAEAILART